MRSSPDPKMQELFEDCTSSFVYDFCIYFNISHEYYEDETGVRFLLYCGDTLKVQDSSYFTTDGGFTYYVYYNQYRDELIRKFSKFKKLKAFL